jgi:hypothetical protein
MRPSPDKPFLININFMNGAPVCGELLMPRTATDFPSLKISAQVAEIAID